MLRNEDYESRKKERNIDLNQQQAIRIARSLEITYTTLLKKHEDNNAKVFRFLRKQKTLEDTLYQSETNCVFCHNKLQVNNAVGVRKKNGI